MLELEWESELELGLGFVLELEWVLGQALGVAVAVGQLEWQVSRSL